MKTLQDFISINDIPYNNLTQSQKDKIDLFIRKLKDAGLEERILEYANPPYHYSIYDQTKTFSSTLPDDLRKEIDKVWTTLHV